MSEKLRSSKGKPDGEFYERPYLPSAGEQSDYSSIPLTAVEAHTVLSDRAGKSMSTLDRLALQRVSDMDDGDDEVDFLKVRRQVAEEFDLDDD